LITWEVFRIINGIDVPVGETRADSAEKACGNLAWRLAKGCQAKIAAICDQLHAEPRLLLAGMARPAAQIVLRGVRTRPPRPVQLALVASHWDLG